MSALVLFDIDKTLIKSSTGHREAFSQGFKEVYSVDTTIDVITHAGMTDQQIIIGVLKNEGLDESKILPKLNECMRAMVDYFNRIKESIQVEVLLGVPELLEALVQQNFLVGLVTGNLEPIARGKMKKAGLDHYFKVGGFGSDDISRTKLVELAIKRAEENYCFIRNKNVFLFGDAPQDMKAGCDAGVFSVGVTTGTYSKLELEIAGANQVVSDLQNTRGIMAILQGVSRIYK